MSLEDAPRNNKFDLPTIARFWYLISGVLITINGFVFIGETFEALGQCTGDNCVGPALRWGSWTGGANDGQNAAWRGVFPLGPNRLFQLWTGVFLGVIMTLVHVPGFKFTFCTRTWIHVSLFSLFAILFGAFPYSGNLGILVGFFSLPLPVLSFILAFTKYRHDPTTLNLRLSHVHCGCLVDNDVFVQITRVLSLIAALAVFIIGLIHVFVQTFEWCPVGNVFECIGPSLRWNPSDAAFLRNSNGPGSGGWGDQIFTFAIDVFFPLWGPVVLGYISMLQHLAGHQWKAISVSWPRVFVWYVFVGLFGAMGYAGNLGILVGFLCLVVALFSLAITLGGGATARTHMDIVIHGYNKGSVTMVTAGVQPRTTFELA